MKPLKLVGIVIGGLVLVLAIGVAVVASQFDADRVKAELGALVLNNTGRTLKIDGALHLSFWPAVAVKLDKASLSERQSQKIFATLDSARLSLALYPLLSKQVVVNAIEVNGLDLALIKHKDGTLNVAEGGAGETPAGGKPAGGTTAGARSGAQNSSGPQASSEPTQLDISSLKVTNSRLDWHDEKSGSTTSVTDLNVSTGRIKADTSGKQYQVDALLLTAKTRSGADAVSVRLESPHLASTLDKAGGQSATLSANVSGPEHKIDLKLALAGIERAASEISIGKMTLDVDATSGASTLKAALTSPLKVNFERHSLVSEQFSGSVDIANPRMPMKSVRLPVNGALRVDLDKISLDGNVATRLDDSRLALKFKVPKMSPLVLGFDLDCDQINVDRYLPKTKVAAGPATGPVPAPTASAAPATTPATPPANAPAVASSAPGKIDLSAIKNLNLSGSIKVGSLQAAHIKASNVNLKLKAANGKLDVAPHSAMLYGGMVSGALSLDSNGNIVTARENLSGVDINPLLKDAVDKDLLEGRGSVNFDISTRGDTVAAMKKAIGGTALVSLKDGALKGINLAKTFRELKANFTGQQDAVQQATLTDKTDFSELSASFRVAKGVAHNEDLAVKSPFLRLGGVGDIDIGNNNLNYLLKASVVNTSGGQGAKELDYLKGVTVPVRASGPFDHLTYQVQFADMATDVLKGKVQEKVQEKKEELKQQLQDQLKDRLKGLFGK
jgi:AsmA protein